MDKDKLRSMTQDALDEARRILTVRRNFEPFIKVAKGDQVTNAPFSGEWFANGRMKDLLFTFLKEFCRKGNVTALVLVTDAWTLHKTPEQDERLRNDPEGFQKALKGGMAECAAAGYGELREVIQSVGQTREHVCSMQLSYQRVTADGLIPATVVANGPCPPHTIRFPDEPVVFDTSETQVAGRMFVLYKDGAMMNGHMHKDGIRFDMPA